MITLCWGNWRWLDRLSIGRVEGDGVSAGKEGMEEGDKCFLESRNTQALC